MDWFRFHHKYPKPATLGLIGQRSAQPVANVLAVFVTMLVDASMSPTRGTLHRWDDDEAAFALGIPTEHVTSIREAMQGRLLDGFDIIDWDKMQPKREDGSDERGRAYRERQRAAREAAAAPTEPDHKRPEPTGNERNRTQQNADERNRPLEESREEKIDDEDEERAPTEANAAGTEPELLTPAKLIATSFDRWRSQSWPHESGFAAPSMTIEHQAQQYLDQGAPLALLLEIIEREMREAAASGKSATHSLAAFKHVLPKAMKAHQQKVILDGEIIGNQPGSRRQPAGGRILGGMARALLAGELGADEAGAGRA